MARQPGQLEEATPRGFVPSVAVKLRRDLAAPSRDERQRLADVSSILKRSGLSEEFGDLEIAPLFASVKDEQLDAMITRARRLDPEYEPADFHAWFELRGSERAESEALVQRLRRVEAIETAYVMRPGPPPVNAADDPRNANQGYLDAAPDGINARYAWGFVPGGGDGAGVGFVDLEQGWNLNHEDLASAGITIISGVSTAYYFHGTSVLGEVRMADNSVGGVGIAPQSSGRVISQWRTSSSYNTADALLDAAANMPVGDVLLIEAQEYAPVLGTYFWPVEVAPANFDAIRLATALGIVVVEAGCNGGYDLDAYTDAGGHHIWDRSSADFQDSGAIMVGAASSTAHDRMWFSNYGSRIDVFAWGENIDTTTTNNAGTDNTAYTTGFSGTSGASPIITGAAVIVQAMAEASLGYRFSPRELREIVKIGGTSSHNPATDEIGVMPDLYAIIHGNQLNLAPDLYLRDYVGDTGAVPTAGAVSLSPDIILRQHPVANPTTAFGPGSGTENDPTLSDEARTVGNNHIYVRLLNRGGSTATNVSVDLYWSPPSLLVSPATWTPIGTITLPSVPTGNVLTVSNDLVWPAAAVPAPGHYCFVAVVGNALDPRPDPAAFATWDNYVAYIENNNNVAWHNFDVVAPGPEAPHYWELGFEIHGALKARRSFEIEAIGQLPEGSRVHLQVPAWLAEAVHRRAVAFEDIAAERDEERGLVRLPLNPHGVNRIGRLNLPADGGVRCRLVVSIPEKAHLADHDFAVRQLYRGREVGRLTWRFAAHAPKRREEEPRGLVGAGVRAR